MLRIHLQDLIPPGLPIISVSKGIEVTTGQLMSEVIPSVLGKKQPTVYLSGADANTLCCPFGTGSLQLVLLS